MENLRVTNQAVNKEGSPLSNYKIQTTSYDLDFIMFYNSASLWHVYVLTRDIN